MAINTVGHVTAMGHNRDRLLNFPTEVKNESLKSKFANSTFYNRLPIEIAHPMKSSRAKANGNDSFTKFKIDAYLQRAELFLKKGKLGLAEDYCERILSASDDSEETTAKTHHSEKATAKTYHILHKIDLAKGDFYNAHIDLGIATFHDKSISRAWFTPENHLKAAEYGLVILKEMRRVSAKKMDQDEVASQIGLFVSEATLALSTARLEHNPFQNEKEIEERAESVKARLKE
ncbi:MAG: hypothetical protein NT051_06135 [Candidatus Micrarchaeota archaeon]|nr:hypothetical protein [Candidatus Micrarchaeota archaeon]